MLPALQNNGYLPPGVHRATFTEIEERFGTSSEIRRVQVESLRWLMDAARRAGVLRLVVNGSFVTDVSEPNDVDCVLLIDEGFTQDREAESELLAGFPFVEIELVNYEGFKLLVERIFASDRSDRPKGMVEILL